MGRGHRCGVHGDLDGGKHVLPGSKMKCTSFVPLVLPGVGTQGVDRGKKPGDDVSFGQCRLCHPQPSIGGLEMKLMSQALF